MCDFGDLGDLLFRDFGDLGDLLFCDLGDLRDLLNLFFSFLGPFRARVEK